MAAGGSKNPRKLRITLKIKGGQPTAGVEGFPESDCPLDPGLGLGGSFKSRLVLRKSKPFFVLISGYVMVVTKCGFEGRVRVDLGPCP